MGNGPRQSRKISRARAATLAARQYGHVSRAQLLALGQTKSAIDHLVAIGWLIPVHAGVYAVGVQRGDALARAQAAVLACGDGALLSHAWAACLWGIRSGWKGLPEVTVSTDRRRPRIRVHRSTTLTRADRRSHQGIRVTSPARTVFDIAPGLTDRQLARAVNEARLSARMRPDQLAEVAGRHPRHPAARRLRPFVERPTRPTRSEFEDAFLAFVKRFGLPTPQVNARVNGREVDVLFEEQRLIVELDGWEFHSDRGSFAEDREKDAAALAEGFGTLRVTWERLIGLPEREADRLWRILRLHG